MITLSKLHSPNVCRSRILRQKLPCHASRKVFAASSKAPATAEFSSPVTNTGVSCSIPWNVQIYTFEPGLSQLQPRCACHPRLCIQEPGQIQWARFIVSPITLYFCSFWFWSFCSSPPIISRIVLLFKKPSVKLQRGASGLNQQNGHCPPGNTYATKNIEMLARTSASKDHPRRM